MTPIEPDNEKPLNLLIVGLRVFAVVFITFASGIVIAFMSLPDYSDVYKYYLNVSIPMLLGSFFIGCVALRWWPVAIINGWVFLQIIVPGDILYYLLVIGAATGMNLIAAYIGSFVTRKLIHAAKHKGKAIE